VTRTKATSLALAALTATVGLVATTGLAQAGSKENFIASDRNRDGALDRREFRAFIDRNAAEGISPAPTIKAQNMYDQAFDMVDSNGDGLFSVSETSSASAIGDDTR